MVEIAVGAPEVSVSAPVEIVVTASNQADAQLEVRPYGCPQVFDVRTLDRAEVVGPEYYSCVLIGLPPRVLDPGESLTFSYTWAGYGIGLDNQSLPPGEYRIRGWAALIPGERIFSDDVTIRVVQQD